MSGQFASGWATVRHRYSLRTSLLWLVAVCVLPATIVSASLLYDNYQLRRTQIDQTTMLLARKVASDIDNELAAIEAALRVLATSPELSSGDLAGFHQRAQKALVGGSVYNYILTDREGRQVINTLRPFGSPLPAAGTPAQLARVFTEERTVLTDLFIGPVTKKPAIAMGVPVRVDGEVRYSLNIGLAPQRLNEILAQENLPDTWLISVLDRSATIVARTREPERFVGEKAVPSLVAEVNQRNEGHFAGRTKDGIETYGAFTQSDRWKWRAVVGAPVATLQADTRPLLLRLVGGTLLALLIGVWVAWWMAKRVLSTVRDLNDAAKALCTGGEARLPDIQFREAEDVGDAIREAGKAMQQVRYLALHDSLTGLANRAMFMEFAERQLALCERHQQTMALIAIDLDGFKAVNDTHGHAVGDDVLVAVARRIENTIRGSDTAARLGGDEFMVLLADADAVQASKTAERLVEQLAQPYAGTPCAVSGSVGIAIYPTHGPTVQALIAQADRALYAAKAAGKHRAVMAHAETV